MEHWARPAELLCPVCAVGWTILDHHPSYQGFIARVQAIVLL